MTTEEQLNSKFKKEYKKVFRLLNYQILESERLALLNLLNGNDYKVFDDIRETEYSKKLHFKIKELLER